MKNIFSSKNYSDNQSIRPLTDSFVVDLRSTVNNDQKNKPELHLTKQTLLKKKQSNLVKTSLKSSFSVPVSLLKHKKQDKNKDSFFIYLKRLLSLKTQKKPSIRSWRSPWPIILPIFYHHWRKRLKYKKELFNLKEFRYYFQASHHYSWKNFQTYLLGKQKRKQKERTEKNLYLLKFYRSIFSFALVLIFIILPFKILAYFNLIDLPQMKGDVLGNSVAALENLAAAADGASSLNWDEALLNFDEAANNLIVAQDRLQYVDNWLLSVASLASDPEIKMASQSKKFLAAALSATEVGKNLSQAAAVFSDDNQEKSWGYLIDNFVEHGTPALIHVQEMRSNLDDIKVEALPREYREDFVNLQQQAAMFEEALSQLLASAQAIKEFLGVSQDKRYLLVFQNNAEMRGAGGFFGSYALVDIRDGKIKALEVPTGGSYDTEAGMRSFIKSPEPLWLVNPRWFFWDANWWPDWPSSARSLMWFYEKSDGPTVDGVISFTPDVLADLLKISGEISLENEYAVTVNADNFWEIIQTIVEKPNLEKTHPELVADVADSPVNEPKKIIGDLMLEIMDRLPQVLTKENLPALLTAVEKNLSSKNILLYFRDESLQTKLKNYNLDAAIKPSPHDYLLISHTNIAGQKTDRRINEHVELLSEIQDDLSVINTLTIYRQHQGQKNEILSGVRNVDWLRVYVPLGSTLLSAQGFEIPDQEYFEKPETDWDDYPLVAETEALALSDPLTKTKIYQENNKTVFANWVMTDPGELQIVRLRYRLPFRLEAKDLELETWYGKLADSLAGDRAKHYPFSLLMQKQPGAKAINVQWNILWPSTWRMLKSYPQGLERKQEFNLEKDIFRAILLEN
ncbi:MAG: DUF4012 domain-containing protein [Patescibacteria group bacterium]|jgi:hypothetical protein|nr:DUF4012 domain-containing protein [Patescibacteria group bacterium]